MYRYDTQRTNARWSVVFLSLLTALIIAGGFHMNMATAEPSLDDLKQKILDRNRRLTELDAEIKKFQQELNVVGKEKQSLQTNIKTLDLSRKKISTDINVTEHKIETALYAMSELEKQILLKELQIRRDTNAIADIMWRVDELENESIVETLLNNDSLADAWDELETLSSFKDSMRGQVQSLSKAKREYEEAMGLHARTKEELAALKNELAEEKSALDLTRSEKDKLLRDTKSKESNYQSMLSEKKRQREQFEKELRSYESELKFVLDKSKIPTLGSSALTWPFDSAYFAECGAYVGALGNPLCITQYFGNTAFAKSGAYNGNGHNGIDFRAPVGTRVTAPLSGTVVATGNTDAYPGCYSYGKWVLLRHNNGLSTLYAHLSSVSVSGGQGVATGQLLGLSGNTGYSTGPHLHFTVYASDGVKVQKLGDIPGRAITGCSPASIPVAGFSAYLNPLDFLPK
jgi:murein DD-endopeptidase MepM/ murein hydrolase activator NlpD